MSNTTKKKIVFTIFICISILFAGVVLFDWLLFDGAIVFDHSGIRYADSFLWKDNHYILTSGRYKHEGKVLAKTDAGDQIMEVDNDKTHTFLVLRSFLDNGLYVREDYEIPTSGQITQVYWAHDIQDTDFCDALTQILVNAKTDLQYETDAPYAHKDGREMYELYVGYEGCPIASQYLGYLGTVNGAWCITTNVEETSEGQYLVSCYQIPQEFVSFLQL